MTPRVFAIIPAAGRSRRMGAAKQLLAVGGRPMLRAVIESLAASTTDGIVVVTHSAIAANLASASSEPHDTVGRSLAEVHRPPLRHPEPTNIARDRGAEQSGDNRIGGAERAAQKSPQTAAHGRREMAARVLIALNDDAESEMIDSIRAGLNQWERRGPLQAPDGILVTPGDKPGIAVADIDRCLAAFRADPETIVIATHNGRRGHPIIFPAALAGFVRGAACDQGLSALPHAHPRLIRLIACDSRAVTRDVDTPEDYEKL